MNEKPKRDYGVGSLFRIKNSELFYFSMPIGKGLRSPRFRCRNKREGQKLFKDWQVQEAAREAQRVVDAQRADVLTVGQHIRGRWNEIRDNRRRTTQITHEQLLENHIYKDQIFRALNVDEVAPKDVAGFIKRVEGSNSMKLRVYKFTRTFFTYLVLEGTIGKNPIFMAELPKVEESKVDAFTVEEQKRLLAYVKGDPLWESLITYMLETGARQSEALGLQRRYVDAGTSKIEIAWALHTIGQETMLQPPKTAAGNRVNKVTPTTLSLVLGQRTGQECGTYRMARKPESAQQRLTAQRHAEGAAGGQFVWTDANGLPWNRNVLNKLWKRLLVKAKVPHRGMHALRHAAITRMLKDRIPATVIAKYVGHTKASLVTDTYASVFDDDVDAICITSANLFQHLYQTAQN